MKGTLKNKNNSTILEDAHTGLSKETLKRAFLDNLFFVQGKFPALATQHDYYLALAYTVRDRLLHYWISTAETYTRQKVRTVAYFSAEFLLGPHLGNNLLNLGIVDQVRQVLPELGLIYEELLRQEVEPGLGNGGLGRLAACFLDSMATLEIPSLGYGIRYEFGIFAQEILNGWQEEKTDKWLRYGNPWEKARPEFMLPISFYGRVIDTPEGKKWVDTQTVFAMPYDNPIPGYNNNIVNTLRLWSAKSPVDFNLKFCKYFLLVYLRFVENFSLILNSFFL